MNEYGLKYKCYANYNSYATPRNIQLGINGEKFVTYVFETLIGKRRLQRELYDVEHQNWYENYTYGEGVDVKVTMNNQPLIDCEVKNLKQQPHPYGTSFIEQEVIPRFNNSVAKLKILFITFINLLTREAKKLLYEANIKVIELGNLIVNNTFKPTLRTFLINNTPYLKHLLQLQPLNNNNSLTTTNKQPITTINNLLTTHDTNIVVVTNSKSKQQFPEQIFSNTPFLGDKGQ